MLVLWWVRLLSGMPFRVRCRCGSWSCLRHGPGLRLSRTRLGSGAGGWLRSGLELRLCRARLRLFRTELRLLWSRLGLGLWPELRLLLLRARLGLSGSDLRTVFRLDRTRFRAHFRLRWARLGRPILRLRGANLGLIGTLLRLIGSKAGAVFRLTRTVLRLTRTSFGLVRADLGLVRALFGLSGASGLDLWSVVDFTGASRAWAILRLAGAG